MLPNHADDQQPLSSLASFYREQLFKEHPHRLQVSIPFFIYVNITLGRGSTLVYIGYRGHKFHKIGARVKTWKRDKKTYFLKYNIGMDSTLK